MSFVEQLGKLSIVQGAYLQQSIHTPPWEDPKVIEILTPLVDEKENIAPYALLAALYVCHLGADNSDYPTLGHSVRQLRTLAPSWWDDVYSYRFQRLLNQPFDRLPSELHYWISLLKRHDIPVCWTRLLADLKAWYHGWQQPVCAEWAKAVWGDIDAGFSIVDGKLVIRSKDDPNAVCVQLDVLPELKGLDNEQRSEIFTKLTEYLNRTFQHRPVNEITLEDMNHEITTYVRRLTNEA